MAVEMGIAKNEQVGVQKIGEFLIRYGLVLLSAYATEETEEKT